MQTAPYFQGTAVNGPVKISTAKTFRDVIDIFRICPVLNVTRAEFLAMPKKLRDEEKHVPFFVAATFRESPSRRIYEKAEHCNLLFIDIDEMKDGRCPAAPFYNTPESLYKALGSLNFAAYTTVSSTPEKPRMRVVVDADGIPVKDYARAVITIGQMLGLPKVTSESKVAVQAMFLPTQFADSSDLDHPLIAHRVDGVKFSIEDIQTGVENNFDQPQRNENGTIDELAFLRAPCPEINLAITTEALDHLDPDCSYMEWLEVAAALKHQFSPHKTELAFELFDKWSGKGSKYDGEESTKAKWDSLRQSPLGRLPITIRTLLKRAAENGWNDQKVKESVFAKLVAWIEEVETVTELMEHGVKKIIAAPLLNNVQEDVLVNQICQNAKKRFRYTISTSAIRKDVTRLRAEIKAQQKPIEKVREPVWTRGVCYIATTQQFYRHRTGEKYRPDAFNASYSRHLLPSEESLKEAGIPITPATLSKPIVPPSEYALNHLKISAVYDYAYEPSQPGEVFLVNGGRKFVNTYFPTFPLPDKLKADKAEEAVKLHLANLISEPDYQRILLDFMAHMVQNPGAKVRWAVLIQSAEGAGKTYFAKVMQAVLGAEHVRILGDGAVKSGWSEWAFGHQLVVVEEIFMGGKNKYALMNTIKPLVTNDDISIDEKFRSNRQVKNITNYMLFSNHHDALALTPNDRRYFVVKSKLQTKDSVLALGNNYFGPLYSMVRDNPGALRSFLLDWQISPEFNPDGHAPKTSYVDELVKDSANDLTAAVRRLLLEADYPLIQYDIVSAKLLLDILHMEGLDYVSAQQLAQVLRGEGYSQTARVMIAGERHYFWLRKGGASEKNFLETVQDRVKHEKKNLSMELFF